MATTARVGIEIAIRGYAAAKKQMADLERQINGLNGRKAYVQAQARVKALRREIAALRSAKVKIQADTRQAQTQIDILRGKINAIPKSPKIHMGRSLVGIKKAANAVSKLDSAMYRIGGRKLHKSFSKPQMGKTVAGIQKATNSVKRLNREVANTDSAVGRINNRKINLGKQYKQAQADIQAATADMQRHQQVLNSVKPPPSLGQIFNRTSSRLSHMGMAMQSMGNALTRMANPIRGAFRYMGFGAGFAAFSKVSEGITSGFTRYDTMKKYPKIMASFGYSAEESQKSIHALDMAVRGLPTGLDEMVQMSQRFTATTGNIEKGTKLAIAANNAFLASMSTDTQKYQGMMQLQDVLGGKDMNAREWNSLVSSMTPAVVKMGESMGYTNKNMDEWIQMVRDGKVANEDFIDTLIKVGNEGGSVAKMALESKDTWQAFAANVGNALSRMTAGVIQSMDGVVAALNIKDKDGLKIDSVNRLLADKITPGIDKLTESAKKWIKANPKKITDFFNSLKGVDWKGIGKGFGSGIMAMAKGVKWLADAFKGRNMSLIGKGMAYLMPVGSFLTILGGIFKGGRFIGGGIVAGLVGIGRVLAGLGGLVGAGKVADLGLKIQKFVKGLKTFGKLKAATEGAEAAGKVAASKSIGLKAHVATIGKSLASLGGVLIGFTAIGGTVWLAVKMIKSIVKDLGTISKDMDNVDVDAMKKLGKWISIIGGLFGTLGVLAGTPTGMAVAGALEAGLLAVGAIVTTISGFAWINTKLMSGTVKNLVKTVEGVTDIAKGINGLKGTKVDVKGFKGVLDGIKESYEAMKESLEGDKWYKNVSVGKVASKYGKVADAIKSVADSVANLKKISNITTDKIDQAKENISTIFTKMDELYDEMDEKFELHSNKDVKGSDKGASIVENISSMIDAVTSTIDNIKTLAESKDINIDAAKTAVDKLLHGKDGKGGIVGIYNDLLGAFATEKSTTYGTSYDGANARTEKEMSIAQSDVANSKGILDIVTNITQMMGQLRGAYNALTSKETGLGDVDTDLFAENAEIAGTLMSAVTGMWTKIKKGMKNFAEIGDVSGQFEGMLGVIKGIKPIITELSTLSQELSGMGGEGEQGAYTPPVPGFEMGKTPGGGLNLTNILGELPSMMDQLKTVADKVAEMDFSVALPNMDSAKTLIEKISELSSYMSNVGAEITSLDMSGIMSFPAKIQLLVNQINSSLNVVTIAAIQNTINMFKATVDSMFAMLNAAFSNIEVTVNINGKVQGHDELIAQIQSANAQIASAVAAIKTSYTKHVTVNIHGSVNKTGNFGGVLHTGGMVSGSGRPIYRAKGGGTTPFGFHPRFKPRGTDTVPAYLTPGEWVHQKKAVDFWGKDFMQKVNHMDVMGVMRSIHAKAMGIATGRHTVVNNNITNNNTNNVTQNINTNNPNFAFRRSRWVGAI